MKKHKYGHEACNFLPTPSGEVFGHFETSQVKVDRAVDINKLGAFPDAERIEHIDVVWMATDPNGGGRHECLCIRNHMAGNLPTYLIAIVTLALTWPTLLIILYDPMRKAWVDEVDKKPVQLQVDEKAAAILSLA